MSQKQDEEMLKRDTELLQLHDQKLFSDVSFIAKGGFGRVYKLKNNKANQNRAVKIIDFSSLDTINEALKEAIKISSLDHPNIIKLHNAFFLTNTNFALELELLSEGSLFEFIKNKIYVPEEILLSIVKQCCSVLTYLNSKEIIHRDIKPENILLRKKSKEGVECVITDFGIAKSVSNHSVFNFSGTIGYLAPELLEDGHTASTVPFSHATDMFALGVTILRLASNSTMKMDVSQMYQVSVESTQKKIKELLVEKKYSETMINLILSMLNPKPKERCTSEKMEQWLKKKREERLLVIEEETKKRKCEEDKKKREEEEKRNTDSSDNNVFSFKITNTANPFSIPPRNNPFSTVATGRRPIRAKRR